MNSQVLIDRIEKHAMLSKDCLDDSKVVLLSSIKRLLATPAPTHDHLPDATKMVEAVEVVGVRISTDGFGSYIADSAMGIGAAQPGEVREPLMTVAQHNRIVSALQASSGIPDGVMVPRELLTRVLEPVTSEQYLNSKHELCALMAAAPAPGGDV